LNHFWEKNRKKLLAAILLSVPIIFIRKFKVYTIFIDVVSNWEGLLTPPLPKGSKGKMNLIKRAGA